MAKKIVGFIKLQVPAGKANPSPPIGPALGQRGLNIMEFCKAFNAQTQGVEPGLPLPVVITAFADKSFTFVMKTPPATVLIKKAAKIDKGSKTPHTDKVGKITRAQLEEIAKRNFVFVSAVFDRRLLDLVGGRLDERLWGTEDYDLWTRFVLAGAAAELIPEPLAWYRIRSDSVSRARERQWKAHLSVLEMHLPTLWLLGAHGRPQDAADIGISLARRGERRMATWFLFHALTDPGAKVLQRARFLLRGGAALVAGQSRDAKAEAAT